jgi:hypothetical protein
MLLPASLAEHVKCAPNNQVGDVRGWPIRGFGTDAPNNLEKEEIWQKTDPFRLFQNAK